MLLELIINIGNRFEWVSYIYVIYSCYNISFWSVSRVTYGHRGTFGMGRGPQQMNIANGIVDHSWKQPASISFIYYRFEQRWWYIVYCSFNFIIYLSMYCLLLLFCRYYTYTYKLLRLLQEMFQFNVCKKFYRDIDCIA